MWQNWALRSSCALPVFLETLDSLPHQLWEGGEVPIGITHVDMTEIGRQGGKKLFYFEAAAIPVQQGPHGEAVTEVVQPRPAARSWTSQPDLSRQDMEGAIHVCFVQPIARAGCKQIGRGTSLQ